MFHGGEKPQHFQVVIFSLSVLIDESVYFSSVQYPAGNTVLFEKHFNKLAFQQTSELLRQ